VTAAGARLTPAQFLSGTLVVAGRELGAALDGGIALVYTIAFTLLANSIFMNEFFLAGTVDMRPWFELLPLLLAFFLPAVTMRLWAEERKQRTVELLLTLPLTPLQAACGKYLAALGLYGGFLLGSLPIVVMLCVLGDPDGGLIVSSYLGLLCFGGLFLAFGLFLSSLSSDQITAFVTSTLLGFTLVLTGNARVAAVLDGLFPALSAGSLLRENLSAMPHYEAFLAGTVSLAAVLYFVLLSALFLLLNAVVLRRSRA
jgi:ABC-2 type transport system permease protein